MKYLVFLEIICEAVHLRLQPKPIKHGNISCLLHWEKASMAKTIVLDDIKALLLKCVLVK